MTTTPPPTGLSEQELTDFEAWAARRGYNTRKEGRRYCHVALNDIHAAVVEFKRASTASESPAKPEPATATATATDIVHLKSLIPNWDLPPIVHGRISVIPSLSCSPIANPDATQAHAQQIAYWSDLFWSVARALDCMPSPSVDRNAHVIKQAEKYAAIVAQAQQDAPDQEQELVMPEDDEVCRDFITSCEVAGIQYDGPSYEAGYRIGRAAAADAQAQQDAPAAVAVPAVPEIAANSPDLLPPMGIRNDRDMLNYLMGAFDSEVHYCERCGHGEDTKDMDSASFLREYLAAAPAQEHATHLAGQGQEEVLRGLLDRRPAMNAGLAQEYALWNAECYQVMGAQARASANDGQAQEDAQDAVRALIAKHAAMLEENAYAYFELAYTRQTGWMAWITDKPFSGPVLNPDRKVLARGQGDTPDTACADAALAAQQAGEKA